MAQLKDLLVAGPSRFIGDMFGNTLQITKVLAPTTSGGSTYGAGSNNQVLRTNGASIYWGSNVTSNEVYMNWSNPTTPNTDKQINLTVNGATAGTIKFVAGSNVTLTATAGSPNTITIASSYTNSRDPGYGGIKVGANSTAVTAVTAQSSDVTLAAKNYNETYTFKPVNKWIMLQGTNSNTAGSDVINIGHALALTTGTAGTTYGQASAATPALGSGTFKVPNITVDAAGHVTAIGEATITMPSYTNSRDPGYGQIKVGANSSALTAVTAQSSDVTIQATGYNELFTFKPVNKWVMLQGTNSGTAGSDVINIGHALSAQTAGTFGSTDNQTPAHGATFNVPYLKTDAAGHVTEAGTKTVTLPADNDHRDSGYGQIKVGANSSAVTAVTAQASDVTIQAATYNELFTFKPVNKWVMLQGTNSGTAGSDVINIGHTLSGVTKGTYGSTSAQTPSYGGTFTVPYVTVDQAGHVTAAGTATTKIPAAHNGYGGIKVVKNSTAVTAPTSLSANTTITAAAPNETFTFQPENKWVGLYASNSGTAGSDVIKIGHVLSSQAAGTFGSTSNQTPAVESTFSVPYLKTDAAGHITEAGAKTVTLPALGDAYLRWGGANLSGDFSPLDSVFNIRLRGNRFAGFNPSGTTIQYSSDGGSTWTDSTTSVITDAMKKALFTTNTSLRLVQSGNVTNNSQLRVIMDTGVGGVYTYLRKIMIYVTTNYSNGCKVTIEAALQNAPDNYTLKICENQPLTGWSGWNVINTGFTTFGNSAASQYGRIRFTFKHDSITSGKEANGLVVLSIYGYGGMGWANPSTLAATDHVYTFDQDFNVTFPNKVTADNGFYGNISGNATTATTLQTAITIWGQSFDGSANVTGNMTDVGSSIKLISGQTGFQFLTSAGGAANGSFGKLGLNSTYANIDFTNYVLDVNGATYIRSTTDSTSVTTGAIRIDGGIGVAKNIWSNGFIKSGGFTSDTTVTSSVFKPAITLYPSNSNEINFGGYYTGDRNIYFGYRKINDREIPTTYHFGPYGQAYITVGEVAAGTTKETFITLGNNKATSEANNGRGRVRMYGTNAYYSDIIPVDQTANRSYYLTTSPVTNAYLLSYHITNGDLNTIYDAGMFIGQGSATNGLNSDGKYYNIISVPYRKACGNTKPDWGWQMGTDTGDNDRLFFRLGNSTAWRAWRQVVHIAKSTGLGSTTKPVYVANTGAITECSTYAGGTAVTLNNASKAASTASFYAPTAGGANNTQALVGAGTTTAPKWVDISPSCAWTAGTTAGPSLKVTVLGQTQGTGAVIPSAGASASGIVTTGAQTFAGAKTFNDNVTVGTTTAGALGIAQTNGLGLGISLYGGPKAAGAVEYGLFFGKTATFGTLGDVTSDWATYFTMSRHDTRGWIFKSNAGAANTNNNVASISGRGHFTGTLGPSSWLDGQRYMNAAYNIADYSNKDSYNPWMRATNTWATGAENAKVGKWFSFGTLGDKFYWMGSTTTRTGNSYDHSLIYNISNGNLSVDGDLYIGLSSGGNRGIYYTGTKNTYEMITFLDNTADQYGNGIKIGGGGLVVIGAGESAGAINVSAGTEDAYLLADENVFIEANANTAANRVGFKVDTGGHIVPVKAEANNNLVQNIGADGVAFKGVYAGNIYLRRQNSTAYGRVSFYQPNYTTWISYMSNAAAGACPTGGTPSTLGDVTNWAQRSIIEQSANYGWIWESCANGAVSENTTKPTPRMALNANNGNLFVRGNVFLSSEAGEVDRSLVFAYRDGTTLTNDNGASWRLIHKASGSGDANYFAIESSTSTTGNSKAWNNVLRAGMNTYNILLSSATDVSAADSATTDAALTVSGGIQTIKGIKIGKFTNTSTAPGYGIKIHDLRNITVTSEIFGQQSVNWYFKQINGNWATSMHMKGWMGSYYSWEIAGNAHDSSIDRYYVRTNSNSAAGTWHTLVYLPAFAAVGGEKKPVYIDANGKVTECGTLVNYAFKTQTEYNAITSPDADTIYFIYESV